MNLLTKSLCLLVRCYRWGVSPLFVALVGPAGLGCRYTPSCSAYALESLQKHGAIRGVWLTICRLGRCHPWGGCGHDPVPNQFPLLRGGPARRSNHAQEPQSARSTLSDPPIATF